MKLFEFIRSKTRKNLLLLLFFIFLLDLCSRPLSGPHFFRQAQTAWPLRMWDLRGFNLIPMLPTKGIYHESWLLEFPLFQYLAFFEHKLLFVSVDMSVRILSMALCASLIFFYLRSYFGLQNSELKIAFYLTFMNPYMLYWGTTGLIDWLAFGLTSFGYGYFWSALRNRRLLLIPLLLLVIISGFLVKFPSALIGAIISLSNPNAWTSTSKSTISKARTFLIWFAVTSAGTLSTYIYGLFQSSLYPPSDPRNVWDLTTTPKSWYFGSLTQYEHLLTHDSEIYGRLARTIMSPTVIVLILIYGLLVHRKYRKTLVTMILASIFYVSIFLNVNLVHDYYQIPVATVLSLSIGFILVKFVTKFNRKWLIVFMLSVFTFAVTLPDQTARTYVRELFARTHQTPGCPSPAVVQSPVIQIGNDDPEYLYACNLMGFIYQSAEPSDVVVFQKEKKEYKYVYRQPAQNWSQVNDVISSLEGRITEINDYWARVTWS